MSGFGDFLMQPINDKIYNNENAGKLDLKQLNKYTLEFTLEISICCDFVMI